MMVSIFSTSKYLTHVDVGGGWVGVWGKREKKSVKTAVYPSRNDCEMLKLCKSKLFQRGNFIIVSIFSTRGIFRTRSNMGVFRQNIKKAPS